MASSLVTSHHNYTQNANLARTLTSTHRTHAIQEPPAAYRDENSLLRSILLKTFKRNKVPPYLREVRPRPFKLPRAGLPRPAAPRLQDLHREHPLQRRPPTSRQSR